MWSWLTIHLHCYENAAIFILIKLCQWNVQCVRNSVLATVRNMTRTDFKLFSFYSKIGHSSNMDLHKRITLALPFSLNV
jgi:hypothetical protein